MIDWSVLFSGRARGCGKTRAMAKACKELGGVMVCSTLREAERVAHEYGIATISALGDPNRMRGMSGPIVFDPDAVATICSVYEHERGAIRGMALDDAIAEIESMVADDGTDYKHVADRVRALKTRNY